MVKSSVEICNLALDYLNEDNITSLTEDTKQSKKCNQWYDVVRKSLLTNLNASWSINRAVLAEVKNVVPVYGYNKCYGLPNDCLQVLNLGSPLSDELYQIEGGYFHCNRESDVQIRYIADVTDVSKYDAEFIELFALALASQICIPLTEDYEKRNYINQLKKEKYVECSTKYGRDNRITVIHKPNYRNARYNAEVQTTNYYLE